MQKWSIDKTGLLFFVKNVVLSLLGLALSWFLAVSVPIWIVNSGFDVFSVEIGYLRYIGWIPIILGAFVFLWCYGLFIIVGKGTPWHFDPPRQMVISGPYRFVRNPMESSYLIILIGEMILFEASVLIFYLLFNFLFLYTRKELFEEDSLERRFGQAYVRYRESVPRWIPRFRPYESVQKTDE